MRKSPPFNTSVPVQEGVTLTVKEAMAYSHMGRNSIYDAIDEGRLPVIHCGRKGKRYLILLTVFDAFLDSESKSHPVLVQENQVLEEGVQGGNAM